MSNWSAANFAAFFLLTALAWWLVKINPVQWAPALLFSVASFNLFTALAHL